MNHFEARGPRWTERFAIALLALCAGCASAAPEPVAPSPQLLAIMQRLAHADEAYRKMAEVRGMLVLALGSSEAEGQLAAFAEQPAPSVGCAAKVAAYRTRLLADMRRGGSQRQLLGGAVVRTNERAQRYARDLLMLEQELAHDPAKCF